MNDKEHDLLQDDCSDESAWQDCELMLNEEYSAKANGKCQCCEEENVDLWEETKKNHTPEFCRECKLKDMMDEYMDNI